MPEDPAAKRANRERRFQLGLCRECPNTRSGDRTLCPDCLTTARAKAAARRSNLRDRGLCYVCGLKPAIEIGKCPDCRRITNERSLAHWRANR